MTELTLTQQRILKVLDRIAKQVQQDDNDAEMWSLEFESLFDELRSQDAFGTEGQCDPRGDQRSGTWAMDYVQGIDDL